MDRDHGILCSSHSQFPLAHALLSLAPGNLPSFPELDDSVTLAPLTFLLPHANLTRCPFLSFTKRGLHSHNMFQKFLLPCDKVRTSYTRFRGNARLKSVGDLLQRHLFCIIHYLHPAFLSMRQASMWCHHGSVAICFWVSPLSLHIATGRKFMLYQSGNCFFVMHKKGESWLLPSKATANQERLDKHESR